jgi:hypothetical protein
VQAGPAAPTLLDPPRKRRDRRGPSAADRRGGSPS